MIKLKNFLIKREQSQTRLSFAECEKSRLIAKLSLTLVALLSMTTGAWAQNSDEVTVTPVTGQTNKWTFTMPAFNVELTPIYAPEFTATFKAGNSNTIQGGKATVSVTESGATEGTGATLDENGNYKPLYEGQTITMTAAAGYKFRTVEVKKGAAVDGNAYLKWDADQKKLVATPMPATATKVEDSNEDVEWAGTYVVEKEVTINGKIILTDNVNLIIKDGAKLIVNRFINGKSKNLSIYSQAQKTGELVVSSDDDAISSLPTLEVHSAKVTATSSGNNRGGFLNIGTFNVYGGLVDAKATGAGYGIGLKAGGSLNIYGGEVKAEGKGNGNYYGILCGSSVNKATLTVYGGKLWAGNADKKAFNNVNLQKGAGFNGKIETSSDNQSWDEYDVAGTLDSKYVKVGY